MSIAMETMVCNLHMGLWEGRKLDKEASRKVSSDNGAASDVANVNKLVIPKETFSKVQAAYSAIYNHYRLHTLPWKDNGDRLLSRKMYMKFIQEHEELVARFRVAVNEFVDVLYPAAVGQAQFRMQGLFNPNDYPMPEQIRGKFYVELVIDAVTEADDFRVKLDEEQTEKIKSRMEAALGERLSKVQEQVWAQLAKAVEKYAERMKADGRLYESTRDNLIELCDILPGLNILNDPNLRSMGREIKQRLGGYDTDALRKDKDLKAAAAKEADEIMAGMAGFMGAFGHNASVK